MKFALSQAESSQRPCKVCAAIPGEPCCDVHGNILAVIHDAREDWREKYDRLYRLGWDLRKSAT